ncbi:MAG: hypothetical protein H6836_04455 [Planctomycetes bacterium]|nr:hypothetical protein [Planctomycetota bacterium]
MLLSTCVVLAWPVAPESRPTAPPAKPPKLSKKQAQAGRDRARRLVEQDEFGNIPHDALMRAKAQMRALHTDGTVGGLDSAKWTGAGPGNVGGRIRSIVAHPTLANTVFVGSVSGGLWRSTDRGATWSRVDDNMGNLSISSLVVDPANPKVMYAGTGEGLGSDRRGAGVFKSSDTGATWTRLASTNIPQFYFVNRLTFSADGKVLLAATNDGVYRTTDGGTSWAQTLAGFGNIQVYDVRFHATKSNVAVAAYRDYDFFNSTWFSVTAYSTDGGVTWTDSTGISVNALARIELAWHAGYTGAGDGCIYAQRNSGNTTLFRSVDGGKSFVQVSTNTGILGSQGDYDNALWVDPSDTDANVNDDVVVAGGIDLWRSTNGGASFTQISIWWNPSSVHADHHAIVADAGYNGTSNRAVYFGNDGGIFRADDVFTAAGTTGWTKLNNSLAITQFYGASRHPGRDILYGGTQDNGTLMTDANKGPNGWTEAVGGDGGFSASDPTDGNYHYGEYIYGQVSRSSNGGVQGDDIWGGGKSAPYIISEAANNQGLFIAPFVLDPHNSNRLLVGLNSLWQSNDVKAPLTASTGPRWGVIKPATASVDPISAITVDPTDANVIWVGHTNGSIFITRNGLAASPTWNRADTGLPGRYVTRIVVDPKDGKHVYALFGGFTANNIWESSNSGTNWTALSSTPQMPVRDMDIHPNNPGWLYLATEVGLLVSEDAGKTWNSSASPSDVPIDELFWSGGNRLYLATHGRGIFWQAQSVADSVVKGAPCQTGTGNPGGPTLRSTPPIIGNSVTFTLTGAPSGTLFASLESAPYTFLGCQVYLNPNVLIPLTPITGSLKLPVINDPALSGFQFAFQAAAPVSGNTYVTNAVVVTFGYY